MNLAKTELAIFYACDGGSGNLQSIPILRLCLPCTFLIVLAWRLLDFDWWKDAIEQCCGWIGFRLFGQVNRPRRSVEKLPYLL